MANTLEGEIGLTVCGDSFQGFGKVQRYSFGFCAGERGRWSLPLLLGNGRREGGEGPCYIIPPASLPYGVHSCVHAGLAFSFRSIGAEAGIWPEDKIFKLIPLLPLISMSVYNPN